MREMMILMMSSLKHMFTGFRFLAPVVLCSLLLGCSVSVIEISGNYPSPLVTQLPLTLGVIYDDNFTNYSFTEIDEYSGEDQYIINSGTTQVQLFNTILPAVFYEVVFLDNLEDVASHPGLDMVFQPAIEEFQVGLPQKTRLDVYEIWVKYNMRLSAPDGASIADWVMTAYGKSPQETFGSVDAGVNEAAVEAFRDLAGTFSLGFTSIPEVNDWLRSNNML
jgi:hypothetical protein